MYPLSKQLVLCRVGEIRLVLVLFCIIIICVIIIYIYLFFSGLAFQLLCYFTNWSQYRLGDGKYLPSNVDPYLCTHLIYAFSIINQENKLTTYEWNDETLYKSFNGLKKKYALSSEVLFVNLFVYRIECVM